MGHSILTANANNAAYKKLTKLVNSNSPLYFYSYTLMGTVLDNVEGIKYLNAKNTNDLKWNTHISNACIRGKRTLGFLKRTLFFVCSQDVREGAYRSLLRPVLEYGSSV